MAVLEPSRPVTSLPVGGGRATTVAIPDRATFVSFSDRAVLTFGFYILWLDNGDGFILDDGSYLELE